MLAMTDMISSRFMLTTVDVYSDKKGHACNDWHDIIEVYALNQLKNIMIYRVLLVMTDMISAILPPVDVYPDK